VSAEILNQHEYMQSAVCHLQYKLSTQDLV